MEAPSKHKYESERLHELKSYNIFNSKKEQSFDELTSFVAEYFNVDACGISIVSNEEVFSKSDFGLKIGMFPREFSICGHTILEENGFMIIEDLQNDKRFFDNPTLSLSSSLRFYAACALKTNNILPIGTFCILDKEPRTLSDDDLKMLRFFSNKCMQMIELRKSKFKLSQKTKTSLRAETENELVVNFISNKILHSNQSLKNNLDNLINSQPENSKTQKELKTISKDFEGINSELGLIKQYLELKEIGIKTPLSLKELLHSAKSQNLESGSLVTLEKDEEIFGAKEELELVLSSILKFTLCKNQQKEVTVSSIKSENQTVIIISSEKGGIDKDEQKNLFTLNLELGALYSSCKGMDIPLSKKIVRLHNGKIQIYSAANAGISFFISLPNS